MNNIIKINNHYYEIKNNKKNRITKKKYLEMKNYQVGGYNLTKRDFIKKVYEHLIKNNVIRNEDRLKDEEIFFNEIDDIANYQSIKTFLFYSYLFTDSKIQPIYIREDITQYLINENNISRQSTYVNDLFKNYFEIHINIDTNGDVINTPEDLDKISELADGAEKFASYTMNNEKLKLDTLYEFLYYEIKNYQNNIWSTIMGVFTNNKNFIILPIQVLYENEGGHQCVIIFDNYNRKIYPFDPNDIESDSIIYKLAENIKEKIKLDTIFNYEIVPASDICSDITMGSNTPVNTNYFKYKCPTSGYSCIAGRGYCVQITFYYISFILNNYDIYNKNINLNSKFIQSLVLDDTNTTDMSVQEFNTFINSKNIDINDNVNNVIIVYHMYQYFKITEWLIENSINPNILKEIGTDIAIYAAVDTAFYAAYGSTVPRIIPYNNSSTQPSIAQDVEMTD